MGTKGAPPPKKPPGTAVNHRQNGQRAVLTEKGTPFELPIKIENPRAQEAWDAYWDDPVSSMVTEADKSMILRWIAMVDRYWKLMEIADADPVITTHNNGEAAHPLYKVALAMENQIERLENKLGISPKSRALLGIQILGFESHKREYERATNAAPSPTTIPDEDEDPRLA